MHNNEKIRDRAFNFMLSHSYLTALIGLKEYLKNMSVCLTTYCPNLRQTALKECKIICQRMADLHVLKLFVILIVFSYNSPRKLRSGPYFPLQHAANWQIVGFLFTQTDIILIKFHRAIRWGM